MSIKPQITLLFLLSVLTVLLIIAAVFPEKGISLTGKLRFRFVTPKDIFTPGEANYADISGIIHENAMLNDSLLQQNMDETPDTIKANADSLRKSISRLQFPKNNKKLLYQAFNAFDKAATTSNPVRIMHYGDSQIEGDRITSFLRNKLQKKFGGMGAGLVPVEQVYDFSFSILQTNSNNWLRYTIYGDRDTTLRHNRYGALASFCRFSPYKLDTLPESDKVYEAWVSFSASGYSYPNTKTFTMCRVFYSHNTEPFLAEVYQDETLSDADMYPVSNSLRTIRWLFDRPVNSIRIVFKGNSSPDIYGIALDGQSGIAVDNIAMRGNPGLFFTKIDKELLEQHYRELNVKMIILQFGGNVVPNIVNDYTYYKKSFATQINRIKQIIPGVAVIVIGVSDMSIKEGNRYVSYPNIEKIRNALKSASFEAGAAYWDLYEAMGGKNSMPSWVFADPPLASSDFVHFNPAGAKIIASMFYNALIFEYNQYKKEQIDKFKKSKEGSDEKNQN
jgi:lysophospholipase L1-like esterase